MPLRVAVVTLLPHLCVAASVPCPIPGMSPRICPPPPSPAGVLSPPAPGCSDAP